jgi:hypothetical protein
LPFGAAGNFGVPEYGRRITNLVKYANSESSSVARRIALVTSH